MVFQNKFQKIIFVIAAIIGYGGVALIVWVFYNLGAFHSNGAQTQAASIFAGFKPLGGKLVCDNGDSGYTIDNSTPWYQAFYTVPGNPETAIRQMAAQKGYQLSTDAQLVQNLSNPDQATTNSSDFTDYNQSNSYLTAQSGGNKLNIGIYRKGTAKLLCSSRWGAELPVPDGKSIVDVQLTLPDTQH